MVRVKSNSGRQSGQSDGKVLKNRKLNQVAAYLNQVCFNHEISAIVLESGVVILESGRVIFESGRGIFESGPCFG